MPDDVCFCPEADLCAIDLSVKVLKEEHIFRALGPRFLSQAPFDVGVEVLLAGYPAGLSDTHHHLLLTRTGHVAFPLSLGWNGNQHHGVSNIAAFESDSGAPVCWQGNAAAIETHQLVPQKLVFGPQLQLIGIYCGGYDDGSRGYSLALGVFVKAHLLAGIISWPLRVVAAPSSHRSPPSASYSPHSSSGCAIPAPLQATLLSCCPN